MYREKYFAKMNEVAPTFDEYISKVLLTIKSNTQLTSNIDNELIGVFVDVMIFNQWFWFAEGLRKTDKSYKLRDTIIVRIEKWIGENFKFDQNEVQSYEKAHHSIFDLHELGYVRFWHNSTEANFSYRYTLCALCPSEFRLTATLLLKSLDILDCFESSIFYSGKHFFRTIFIADTGPFDSELLETQVKKYEAQGTSK